MGYLYTDGPSNYDEPDAYYSEGCNPRLLDKFLKYIDDRADSISSIKLVLYLFNNLYLLERLEDYARRGIDVTVTSIPLDGYQDKSPAQIVSYKTGNTVSEEETKRSLANDVYEKAEEYSRNCDKFRLLVFPHMFIRSKSIKPFVRGQSPLPYSLHAKLALIEYKDGTGAAVLTSSNFCVRDEVKENLLTIIDDQSVVAVARKFFSDFEDCSIDEREFDESRGYRDYLTYYPAMRKAPGRKGALVFQAPFYADSPHYARNRICDLLDNASDRILICAQHVSAYQYKEGGKTVDGILKSALDAANRGVKTSFLSQTYGGKTDQRNRRPRNSSAFKAFADELNNVQNGTVSYFVNPRVHSKFLVIDDTAIITTCNLTPAQFIFLPKYTIKKGEDKNWPDLEYRGAFAEVGAWYFNQNQRLCEKLEHVFYQVANDDGASQVMGK